MVKSRCWWLFAELFTESRTHQPMKKTKKRRQWGTGMKRSSPPVRSQRRASVKSKETKIEKLILLARKNKRKALKVKKSSSSRRGHRSSSKKKAKI